nr:alpha/beta fold hydrolase [Auraticoccus cholistanensis]
MPDAGRTWWSWRHLIPLLGAGRAVLALDPRGTGASDRTPSGYRLPDTVDDLHALLDALAVPRVVLVGHGWGGISATALAAAHPERVRALALVAAPAPPALQGYRRLLAGALAGTRVLTPQRLHAWAGADLPASSPCVQALREWPGPQRALAPLRSAALHPATLRALRTGPRAVPTLHVRAAADPLLPRPRLGAPAPVVLPGGHQLPEDSPTALAATLTGWLQSLPA